MTRLPRLSPRLFLYAALAVIWAAFVIALKGL